MKIRLPFTFLLAIAILNVTFADPILSSTTIYGEERSGFESFPIFYRNFRKNFSQAYIRSFDLNLIDTCNYKTRSDIALHLAKLGRYKESLAIYQKLYPLHSNSYRILSNLGMLYELNGKNDLALIMTKKAMNLNPDFHLGSEWVHIKILEAKLKMENDSLWILGNKVLNLNVEHAKEEITPNINHGNIAPLFQKNRQFLYDITYQLQKIIPFSPAPNLIIANVLNEYGDIMASELSVNYAYIVYHMALEYDPTDTYKVSDKINAIVTLLNERNSSPPSAELIEYYFPKDKEPLVDTEEEMYTSSGTQFYRAYQFQRDEEIEANKMKIPFKGLFFSTVGIIALFLAFYSLKKNPW